MSKLPLPLKPMMRLFPIFMKLWLLMICCHRSMWWIQAMSMPRNWSTVGKTTTWISLDQPERIIIGKRGKTLVLRHHNSTSIGNTSMPLVQQAKRVGVGHQPRIDEAIPSSKSNLRCRIVALVRAVHNAPKADPTRHVGFSQSVPSLSIRPYKLHDNVREPKLSKPPMTNVLALRGHSPKVFVPLDYAKHATK